MIEGGMRHDHAKLVHQGPLILLPFLHYRMLRRCSLHNVNLGLAQTATASALPPDSYFVCVPHQLDGDLRLLRAELGFWGDASTMPLQDCLVAAYNDFRSWCALENVSCADWSVTQLSLAMFVCRAAWL